MSPKSNLPLKFFFQNLVSTSLHTEVVKKRKKISKNYVSGWFLREVAHISGVFVFRPNLFDRLDKIKIYMYLIYVFLISVDRAKPITWSMCLLIALTTGCV